MLGGRDAMRATVYPKMDQTLIAQALANQQQPGDTSAPRPTGGVNLNTDVGNSPPNLVDPLGSSSDSPSFGKSLLQGTVNTVPGAYYSGLAQRQFKQGNYGAATVYGAAALGDAALGIATLGTSTRVGTAVRAGAVNLFRGAVSAIGDSKAVAAANQLAANRAAGVAFEQAVGAGLEQGRLTIGRQVTIGTESGIRTRLDFLARDPVTGQIGCIECKASQAAPLTPNQSLAFPQIEQSGGTILGAGKPGFPGGTQIPPTAVQIIRGP